MRSVDSALSGTGMAMLAMSGGACAQDTLKDVLEPPPFASVAPTAYIPENTSTQRVIPYPHIREADVMWSLRVWRVIDLREKINHPLYYPTEPILDRKSLFDVITTALLVDGSITAYDVGPIGQDDAFTKPLSAVEINALLTRTDTVYVENEVGELMASPQVEVLRSSDIRMYKLKEDWIFDKQRSVIDIRIIGIAPMREIKGEDGEVRGYAPIFWLYYPELRYVLKNHATFNQENDVERRSFDHLFWTRRFNSYITKVSNVYDRQIVDYSTGIDALMEGEAIKARLFEFEHDLWNW